jgi:hypothetical protein
MKNKETKFRLVPISEINVSGKVGFGQWLLRQHKRDDEVGDLAKDFARCAKNSPFLQAIEHPSEFADHLTESSASSVAFCALHAAKKEYDKYLPSV